MNGKRVGSLCSGAGGFDLGFHRAGYRTAWTCEIDPWRRALLQRRFGCPVHPDIAGLDPGALERIDVLIGGTPCQDLSVAGQRAGLDGERSGLFWHFMRLRNHLEPEWTVWENVAGALSSNDGLDFASVLAAFVGADVLVPGGGWPGAGVAAGPWGGCVYRVLDAQHFGVPQRRRRVFVVGRLGGPCPPEVLLEPASGGGDPAARRGSGAGTADAPRSGVDVARSLLKSGGHSKHDDTLDTYVVDGPVGTPPSRGRTGGFDVDPSMAADGHLIAAPLTRRGARGPGVNEPGRRQEDDVNLVAHTLRAEGFDASEDGTGRGTPLTVIDGAAPDPDGMRAADVVAGRVDGPAVTAFDWQAGDPASDRDHTGRGRKWIARAGDYTGALGATRRDGIAAFGLLESDLCAYDPQPDGRRYAACGDGVVANVAEWIARRIVEHGGEAA